MNDPSIDNPRLLTAEGEEEHIAREELLAGGLTYAGCTRLHADGTPRERPLDFSGIEARIAAQLRERSAGPFTIVAARVYTDADLGV